MRWRRIVPALCQLALIALLFADVFGVSIVTAATATPVRATNTDGGVRLHGWQEANCTQCPAGSAQNLSNPDCLSCEPGYCQNGACMGCPPGQYSNAAGLVNCSLCDAGYTSDYASTGCRMCPAGQFSAAPGSLCTYCPMGQYNDFEGRTTCLDCDYGTYQDWTGMSTCRDCGIGRYNSERAAESFDSCVLCPAGSYCPYSRTAAPIPCPSLFESDMGAATCEAAASLYVVIVFVLVAVCGAVAVAVRCLCCRRPSPIDSNLGPSETTSLVSPAPIVHNPTAGWAGGRHPGGSGTSKKPEKKPPVYTGL